MAISMLKIRRPLGRLIFNMGIAIPGKTVFLIETAPRSHGVLIGLKRGLREEQNVVILNSIITFIIDCPLTIVYCTRLLYVTCIWVWYYQTNIVGALSICTYIFPKDVFGPCSKQSDNQNLNLEAPNFARSVWSTSCRMGNQGFKYSHTGQLFSYSELFKETFVEFKFHITQVNQNI